MIPVLRLIHNGRCYPNLGVTLKDGRKTLHIAPPKPQYMSLERPFKVVGMLWFNV